MIWKIKKTVKNLPKLNNPILIEGLPGIGNVGKIAIDFIIDELNAKKIIEFSSNTLPNSVFVNEKNIVELPGIELYACKRKGKKGDLLFLTGDVQPIDEVSCYEFSEAVLELLSSMKGKELITIGGIGLPNVPKIPKVYCTGNANDIINKYKHGTILHTKLYGVVGPIVGVSGLLVGLAHKHNINAVCLLAETIGHPMYLGMHGAREVMKILSKKLDMDMDFKKINNEIKEIETSVLNQNKSQRLKKIKSMSQFSDVNYIG